MMIHGVETSHPLTLSFSDLSVWCYQCEAYIDNHVSFIFKYPWKRKIQNYECNENRNKKRIAVNFEQHRALPKDHEKFST